jgi:hypothetical protein
MARGILLMAALSLAAGKATDARDDARDTAIKSPCDVAAAILGAARGSKTASHQGRWTAAVSPSCGGPHLAEKPVVVTFLPEGRQLIGWKQPACPGGPSGPRALPGKRADFYDIGLTVRNEKMLDYEVTPHYVDFDDKGRKVADVIQGCSDVVGTVYLDVQPGAPAERPRRRR